jgi:carboxymethylenebutenolidase
MILTGAAGLGFAQAMGLPPGEAGVKDRLATSPRHGEWARVDAGGGDSVDTWVVYPERPDKAPVVIVIHEIFGLNDWARAVADQLAAEGFIAIAPDLLSGKGPGGKGTASVDADAARQLVGQLQSSEVVRRLNAVASYGAGLPASTGEYGVVGFCWGGGISFLYATEQPALKAAVVCYGTAPGAQALGRIKAPVLGLYGGNDARVNATIPAAEAEMKKLGKRYEYEIFDGAGHAFFRAQDGQAGANLKATQKGWPRMVQFFKQSFKTGVSSLAGDGWISLASADSVDECPCGDEDQAGTIALQVRTAD